MNPEETTYWLNEASPLAKKLPGFSPRASQIELAEAIETAIAQQSMLVAEAGTGTGKTFAYLIPALLSGKKVIISTGTKTLQDQLYFRDIPALRRAMAAPAKISLLKGRSNYLCLQRMEQSEHHLFPNKATIAHVQQIKKQAASTKFGDISEIRDLPDQSLAWYYVTSTVDNCLGSECPQLEDCYLMKARRKAMVADVVVINHHLLFADAMLKEENTGELLPEAEVLIIDEAHQIPEVASQFLGTRFSSRQITELIKDSQLEQGKDAKEALHLAGYSDALEQIFTDLRLALGEAQTKAAWNPHSTPLFDRILEKAHEQLQAFSKELEALAPQGKGLENCWQRCLELIHLFQQVTSKNDSSQVHWFEVFSQSFSIYLTPLSIAEPFQQWLAGKQQTWVFTSATLTVNENFDLFKKQLGLTQARELILPSPFPYEDHALLYVPRQMPDPNSPDYTEQVVAAAVPLIRQNKGRTFFLFTSHRALRQASELLAQQIDYRLFVQGEGAKDQLLRDFVADGHGVLLGTYSFWEGVDVRGATLSCVIIDKLPFQSPEDPVGMARANALKSQGKNAFYDDQLPKSVLSLKQGVGRLIRDMTDMGVIMIGDPRLVAREYGKIFLASLPPMQRTRSKETVLSFLQHMTQVEENRDEVISD